jgi:hypothetical protein
MRALETIPGPINKVHADLSEALAAISSGKEHSLKEDHTLLQLLQAAHRGADANAFARHGGSGLLASLAGSAGPILQPTTPTREGLQQLHTLAQGLLDASASIDKDAWTFSRGWNMTRLEAIASSADESRERKALARRLFKATNVRKFG